MEDTLDWNKKNNVIHATNIKIKKPFNCIIYNFPIGINRHYLSNTTTYYRDFKIKLLTNMWLINNVCREKEEELILSLPELTLHTAWTNSIQDIDLSKPLNISLTFEKITKKTYSLKNIMEEKNG